MDFALPPVGEGLIEVELVRWIAAPGQLVKRGQPLMEVMSDKATMEVPAAFEGTIRQVIGEPGQKIKVGQVVMQYDPAERLASEPAPHQMKMPTVLGELSGVTGRTATIARPAPTTATAAKGHIAAAPSVRHLARQLDLDLAKIRGTGPGGRILLDDLAPYLKSNGKPAEAPKPKPESPGFDLGQPGTRTKLIGLRRKIAEHMVASKRAIPHYSYVDECDFTELIRLRGQLKGHFADGGIKLTYLPFIVKAAARALKHVPLVNATFDDTTQELTLHDRYHIGIAVAAPNGLLVPVIKDADKKDVPTIAREIERLSGDARSGSIKLDDLKGGTFTVTSIGSIGGLISTPIINSPEVGIVGVGKVVRKPAYDDHGQIHPADLAYLSFSFDHRVLDGAIGAIFGNAIIKQLQHPAALLMGEKV